MAGENPFISDELSADLLGLRRQRTGDLVNIVTTAPAAASAAWHRDPGGAAAVFERSRPKRMTPQEFEAMKLQLKMKIMKQMQDYENAQLSGIEGIIKAVSNTDKAGMEIFKSLLRANGLTDEAGNLSGGGSVDKSYASAMANMHGSALEFAQTIMKDTGANPAGVGKVMDQVFQAALATPDMWLHAGGPLENLARFVQSNISAGDPSTAYGGITAVAAMMAMQNKDLKAILASNTDKPIFKFLYEQLDEAGRWSDRFNVNAKLIGTMMGYTNRAMDQVANDVAKSEAQRTGQPDGTPDINKRIDDVLGQTKKVMDGLGISTNPDGTMDVLETESLIDKIRGPASESVDRAAYQQYLEALDKWKGDLTTAGLRQKILESEGFKAFKEKLGLKNDDIALKEAMRQNAILLREEKMADRATIRSWKNANGAPESSPRPTDSQGHATNSGSKASAGMVSQAPRLGANAPAPGTTAQPEGLIEPGNIDLNNRSVVPQAEAQADVSDKPPEFVRGPDGAVWVLSYTAKTFQPITEEEMNDIAAQVGADASSLVQDASKFEEAKKRYEALKGSGAPAGAGAPTPPSAGSSLEPIGDVTSALPQRYARGAAPIETPDASDDVPAARKSVMDGKDDLFDFDFSHKNRQIGTPGQPGPKDISSGVTIPGSLTPPPYPGVSPYERSLEALRDGNLFNASAPSVARVKKRRNPFLNEELNGAVGLLPR